MTLKEDKRRYTRYRPDQSTFALLTDQDLESPIFALVLTESYGGCGLVVLQKNPLKIGSKVHIEIGKIGPLRSEVVWISDVSAEVQKVGIKFLE